MLARLSAMLPIPVRGMWVGTFHGLCHRFLRAHWKLAGLPQGFQILDTQDQLSRRQARHQGDEPRRGALRAARRSPAFISGSKDDGLRPKDVVAHRRAQPQAGAHLRGLRGAVPARGLGRLRRADAAHLRADARRRAAARALPAALPAHPGRRVPGHQPAAVRLAEDVRRPGRQRRRGRRRRPEHLRLPRRQGRQHGRLRARVRGREGHQAGAELPQPQQHPRRRQRPDLAQHAAPRQEPAHRRRRRRAGAGARGDQRLRRGAVVRRGGAAAAPRGHAAPARSRCSTAATRSRG